MARKSSGKRRKKTGKSATEAPKQPDRRAILRYAGYGAAGCVVAGGAGAWAIQSFRHFTAEHDLSRLGQGQAAIVQVHDPNCPSCTSLQRQTRRALRCLADAAPIYLVANLDTVEGATFAARFGAGRVTLLLFDGEGQFEQALAGVRDMDELKPIFAELTTRVS